jgi:hypothetical protein
MRSTPQLFVLPLIATLAACATEEEAPDPTSVAALRKAPSLQSGCSYVEHEASSFGSSFETSDTPRCSLLSCAELSPPSDYVAYAGGSDLYESRTYYFDKVDFLGTCDDPQPISCEGRAGADACEQCVVEHDCAALVLCESDPNCVAITDCIGGCREDQACASRCLQNGDYYARKNLNRLADAVTGTCASSCE